MREYSRKNNNIKMEILDGVLIVKTNYEKGYFSCGSHTHNF